jgi:hypothetical protein
MGALRNDAVHTVAWAISTRLEKAQRLLKGARLVIEAQKE